MNEPEPGPVGRVRGIAATERHIPGPSEEGLDKARLRFLAELARGVAGRLGAGPSHLVEAARVLLGRVAHLPARAPNHQPPEPDPLGCGCPMVEET